MNVEIYSDVVCPWCYLGQARFRAAVARFGGDVRVTWRPFQLDPAAPATVRPAGEVLAEKFGGPEQVAAAHDRLRALTAAEGLPFAPEKSLSINTRDAHRVIGLAGTAGVQDAVVERFFRAHHAEGRNLADADTLAELAAEGGPGRRGGTRPAGDRPGRRGGRGTGGQGPCAGHRGRPVLPLRGAVGRLGRPVHRDPGVRPPPGRRQHRLLIVAGPSAFSVGGFLWQGMVKPGSGGSFVLVAE